MDLSTTSANDAPFPVNLDLVAQESRSGARLALLLRELRETVNISALREAGGDPSSSVVY